MKNRIAAMIIVATTAAAALSGAQTAHAGVSWDDTRSAWFSAYGSDVDSETAWYEAADAAYADAKAWCGGEVMWTDTETYGGMSPGLFDAPPRYIYYVSIEYRRL